MEQIEEAVRCALDPSSAQDIKTQATQYCERVKASPDGWQVCLELFTTTPQRAPEARLFALQVVETMIASAGARGDANGAAPKLEVVRKTLLEFVSSQYSGAVYHSELPFIKNTLAHTFSIMMLATYPSQWPTFVKDMVLLAGLPATSGPLTDDSASATSSAAINPSLVDFLLRVLSSLDEVMINPTVPRSTEETARNTEIKDAMRVEDVSRMAHAWLAILVHMSSAHPDLAQTTLRLVGTYVSWIDIGLIVNQPFMKILFGLLKTPTLRCQACHCLAEIVGKGMRAMDKLYLLQFLDIIGVMKQLDVDDIEFAEEAGKLANITGVELLGIWSDKETATPDARVAASGMLEELIPLILSFLAHEYDEVSSSVFPAITEILSMFKRLQRESTALSASQQEFLSRLLPNLVEKLKYGEDYSWPNPNDTSTADVDASLDDDDEEAIFSELRRSLRTFIDAIAVINPGLYDNVMLTTAQNVFKQCNQYGVSADNAADEISSGSGRLGWVRAELGIYLAQAYGDRLVSTKNLRFGSAKHGQTNGTHSDNRSASNPSTESFAELLSMMIQSGIIECSHPSIAPLYFENLVRFSGYFDVYRDAVTPVLKSLLGATGVRHPQSSVRPRIWYLLRRFIEQHLTMGLTVYSSDFISAVSDMLSISANPSSIQGSYGVFDSQLYLFEACGIMLAPADLDDSTRTTLLQYLFSPLFSGAQALMNTKSAEQILQEPASLLQIHHYMLAIGAIISGFPNIRVDSKTTSAGAPHQLSTNTVQVFLKAADMCIAILEVLRTSQLVREAARATLSRMLSVLGTEALPYLPRLIDSLVSNCAVEELLDLLGLIGLVVFKFKPYVAPTASKLLLPVISKVYGFLDKVAQEGATGTDEAVLLQDLRKAYLTLIGAIFNADLDSVFLDPQNAQHLVLIFQPIATQLAVDHTNAQCQRLAFNVIFKAIQAWIVDPLGYHTLATLTPAAIAALNNDAKTGAKNPDRQMLRQAAARALGVDLASDSAKAARDQFKQFAMKTVAPACFETPTRPQFQMADAQSSLVVSEIASVLQILLVAGMPAIAQGDGSAAAEMAAPQLLSVPIGGDLGHNHFASYLSTSLLPSMGCPENMAVEFVQALSTLGQKQFKKYFVAFLTSSG
ncbi:pre-tRNA nuclear export protein [Coemansia sp. RSA 1813]|nr:pre-tRNA nuclear export protein [Coemansia sp. RSA 1843]KAJ2217090.1 pre-tRNA nuclear export protein [Coemansia sp. RSA 487]KAJ2568272.1 pre-tRNA nuclear export protein [Coemansia sp. RSA 1813]